MTKNEKKEQDQERWTGNDGTAYHEIIGYKAEDRFDYETTGRDVDRELRVQCRNESLEITGGGRIDLLIDERFVFDFKTDQMNGWSESYARKLGDQYGSKVASYVRSPQVRREAEGHLVMVGRRHADPRVESAFREAAAKHNVSTMFCDGGDPQAVLDRIDQDVLQKHPTKTEGPSKGTKDEPTRLGHDRSRQFQDDLARQYRNTILQDRRDELHNIFMAGRKRDRQTVAELKHDTPSIENERQQQTHAGGLDVCVTLLMGAAVIQKGLENRRSKLMASKDNHGHERSVLENDKALKPDPPERSAQEPRNQFAKKSNKSLEQIELAKEDKDDKDRSK
jgi:hypothetical protein